MPDYIICCNAPYGSAFYLTFFFGLKPKTIVYLPMWVCVEYLHSLNKKIQCIYASPKSFQFISHTHTHDEAYIVILTILMSVKQQRRTERLNNDEISIDKE